MSKVVKVTAEQVMAAQLVVEIYQKLGRPSDPAVVKIANAQRAQRHDAAAVPERTAS